MVLLQVWPPRYRWSKEVSWTVGEESGMAIHQVKLGRRRRRIWKRRGSPTDVTFRARVAVTGIGEKSRAEKIVAIPVDKEWRPVVGQAVLVTLLPEQCDERDLRYFPNDIRSKRANRTLRLEDLLRIENTELRVYVFAYRPRVGTRWMRRGKYTLKSIQPGGFRGMTIDPPEDGKPPVRPDLLNSHQRLATPRPSDLASEPTPPAVAVAVGAWAIEIRRRHR